MSETDLSKPWFDAVEQYVDELQGLVDEIDLRLDDLRLSTVEAGPSKIEPALLTLAKSIDQLEQMVVRRETLLREPSAPPQGLTLKEKLLSIRRIDAAELARRCGEVAASVAMVNTRATSLFVCHYHLHGITSELVKTITGDKRSSTYSRGGDDSTPPRGGIFDDAA